MADNSTFAEYQKSGFNEASGVAGLKQQTSEIPTSDDALRQQAVDQYADTLSRLDQSYSKQISNLITSQATDEKLLNEQYNNSITSMMAQLQKRGLHVTGSLPQAQTAALNKHRNDVMAMRQSIYKLQREVPEQKQKLLTTDYEKAISQRVAANRATNVPTLTDLLGKISELQNSSYEAYINHLLDKKARSGGGGGYRRSYSSNNNSNNNSGTKPKVNLDPYTGENGKMIGNYGAGGWSHWYPSKK